MSRRNGKCQVLQLLRPTFGFASVTLLVVHGRRRDATTQLTAAGDIYSDFCEPAGPRPVSEAPKIIMDIFTRDGWCKAADIVCIPALALAEVLPDGSRAIRTEQICLDIAVINRVLFRLANERGWEMSSVDLQLLLCHLRCYFARVPGDKGKVACSCQVGSTGTVVQDLCKSRTLRICQGDCTHASCMKRCFAECQSCNMSALALTPSRPDPCVGQRSSLTCIVFSVEFHETHTLTDNLRIRLIPVRPIRLSECPASCVWLWCSVWW